MLSTELLNCRRDASGRREKYQWIQLMNFSINKIEILQEIMLNYLHLNH